MSDGLVLTFIVPGIPLLLIAIVSWGLHYFIALTSPPSRRAAWSAGIAYVIIVLGGLLMIPAQYTWAAPLAPIPATLIAFLWWRHDFQNDWINDGETVPEGVELATDDWRIGLLQLLALITVLVGIAFFKFIIRAL